MAHINHPAIVKRLKRADGHLQKIIEMIEAGKPCIQLAQQLQAVESGIENAKKALIHDHLGTAWIKRSKKPGRLGVLRCGNSNPSRGISDETRSQTGWVWFLTASELRPA